MTTTEFKRYPWNEPDKAVPMLPFWLAINATKIYVSQLNTEHVSKAMRNLNPYREFTFGWIIFAFVLPVYGLLTYLFVNNLGDRPINNAGFVFVTLLIVVICLLFYGMTTKITGDRISISYGLGVIRKNIPLSRIASVEPSESPWWYGWGIRLIPKGMMYNISGTESVELKFNDTDRIFRIGTKNPLLLAREIKLRIAN